MCYRVYQESYQEKHPDVNVLGLIACSISYSGPIEA